MANTGSLGERLDVISEQLDLLTTQMAANSAVIQAMLTALQSLDKKTK